MSGSHATSNNHEGETTSVPRAVVHKKILDAAARPAASMEEVADEVSGASIDLVEKVLEEYGDPAAEGLNTGDEAPKSATRSDRFGDDDEPSTDDDGDRTAPTDPDRDLPQLFEKQLETLRAIYERPQATQAELGTALGISDATVCQRVNAIDGFDWKSRHEFVKPLFEDGGGGSAETGSSGSSVEDLSILVDDLSRHLDALDELLARHVPSSRVPFDDSRLLQKVVHACFRSDHLSEDEQLLIIQWLLGGRIESNLIDSTGRCPSFHGRSDRVADP